MKPVAKKLMFRLLALDLSLTKLHSTKLVIFYKDILYTDSININFRDHFGTQSQYPNSMSLNVDTYASFEKRCHEYRHVKTWDS